MALNEKQRRFAKEYLTDFNATQAAIRAGYSEKTAGVQAHKLLKKAEISSLISKSKVKQETKLEITQERVLAEIARMAFFDPAEVMLNLQETYPDAQWSDNGRAIYGLTGPGDIRDLPEDVRRAIVGWSWDKQGRFTVKLADKQKALDQLGKHLRLFVDRVEHTGEINLVQIDKDDAGLVG